MGAEAPQPDRVWACAAYGAALVYPMEQASFCADVWQPARASHRLGAGRLGHRSRQRHVVPQDRHWEREDAIAEGVAAVPEIEHDPVCEPVAEPVAQPTHVPQVTTGDGGRCLHLDACDPAAWTFQHEVDLAAVVVPIMEDVEARATRRGQLGQLAEDERLDKTTQRRAADIADGGDVYSQ